MSWSSAERTRLRKRRWIFIAPGANVTLVHRRAELGSTIKYWVRPDIENRIKAGQIRALFETEVKRIEPGRVWVSSHAGEKVLPADQVFALTGYHPDFEFLRSLGISLDPSTNKPTMDPQTHESNVPGIFLAGVVIGGNHTSEIFIENGRFHGKQIIAALTGGRTAFQSFVDHLARASGISARTIAFAAHPRLC